MNNEVNKVLEILFQAAKLEAEQMRKKGGTNYAPPQKPTVDLTKEAQDSAKCAKTLYDAFMSAGFTVEQSFELTKNIMTPVKRA